MLPVVNITHVLQSESINFHFDNQVHCKLTIINRTKIIDKFYLQKLNLADNEQYPLSIEPKLLSVQLPPLFEDQIKNVVPCMLPVMIVRYRE